ncbi:MAG: dihydroorotase [Candidatus Latescibacteria bacterium 4484_107]|nr:MAG: dihydroorotase [Candidatus Latescibacteria bacterium 4484_107]
MKKWVIRGGRVLDPAIGFDQVTDIWIEDGRIAHLGDGEAASGVEVIHAEGLVVAPGLIDMHVHFREPGDAHKETIASGSAAAESGGFTAVAVMPNTKPVADSAEHVRWVLNRARGGPVRVLPIAAVTKGQRGEALVEMKALRAAGAVAFSDDGQPIEDERLMRRVLARSRELDVLIITHSEIKSLSRSGCINEGDVASELGVKGISPEAESRMIARDLKLLEEIGGRLHIAHVSAAESVAFIRAAKTRGLPVTCETAPHYFTLTEEAVRTFGPNAKMSPPLRTARDVAAIREGLTDGTIDVIASDHAPHAPQEKALGLKAAPFGIVGLETSLGLVLTELVQPGLLSLSEAIAKMSLRPAQILRVEGGRIREGCSADLTLIAPDEDWTVDVGRFRSKSRNTPFAGRILRGRAVMTFRGGEKRGRDR